MVIKEDQALMSFSGALRQEVHKFEQFWFLRHQEDPKTWPLSMTTIEWEEHFRAWQSA